MVWMFENYNDPLAELMNLVNAFISGNSDSTLVSTVTQECAQISLPGKEQTALEGISQLAIQQTQQSEQAINPQSTPPKESIETAA